MDYQDSYWRLWEYEACLKCRGWMLMTLQLIWEILGLILDPEIDYFLKFVRWDFGYCSHYWPIIPAPDDRLEWSWRNWWNEDWQGKPKYSEKTCPSASLSTTNSTWRDPSLNLGHHGGKPATNRLSYGVALRFIILMGFMGILSPSNQILA
jgi:hypothetical protein